MKNKDRIGKKEQSGKSNKIGSSSNSKSKQHNKEGQCVVPIASDKKTQIKGMQVQQGKQQSSWTSLKNRCHSW